MKAHGRGAVIAVIVLALLAVAGYTGFAGTAVYQHLDSGRPGVGPAEAGMSAPLQPADPAQLRVAADQLVQAERDFSDAGRRARTDPALQAASVVPAAG